MIAPRRFEPASAAPGRAARRAAAFLLLAAVAAAAASCASRPATVDLRDDFPFDPREGLVTPFPRAVEEGWKALVSGDAAGAMERFAKEAVDPSAPAAAIGRLEAALELQDNAEASALCDRLLPAAPRTVPLLASCGEAAARAGRRLEGLALYREALELSPNRSGLRARAEALHAAAREELLRDAHAQAAAGETAEARRLYQQAVELDPRSSRVLAAAAAFEMETGSRPEALRLYREALDNDPSSLELQAKVAELALEEGDPALSVSLYESLARADPAYAEKASEARIAFRVQNWPAQEQLAAQASRLTRAQAASLVWWSVPEVRDAVVTSGVIASDIVGRADQRVIARMLALGLLEADDNHRSRPDAPLTAPAGARLSLRLLAMLRPGREPLDCLKDRPVRRSGQAIAAAQACGIPVPTSGVLSGRDLLRALDRVRVLSSEAAAP